jgi:hypothetical protein
MDSANFEFLYLLALFSPADLATMLLLVGVIAKFGDEEDAITMRGAFALMLSVGFITFLVTFPLEAVGSPKWLISVAHFAVWWGVLMFKANIAPLAATVVVACLVGVNLLGHAIQDRLMRPALKQMSQPALDETLRTLDDLGRGKK